MTRDSIFALWKSGIVLSALGLFVAALVMLPTELSMTGVVLALLVVVAAFLRHDTGDEAVGFEAVVGFGALLVFHDTWLLVTALAGGSLAHAMYRNLVARRWSVEPLYEAAQLTISFWIAGTLYALAVARDADGAAKAAGYILLLFGFAATHLLFLALRRAVESGPGAVDYRRLLLLEAKMLVLVTPAVAIAVMLHEGWGLTGFAIAFLPVLIVAYALRNEAEAAKQNVELLRRNKELAILTESSTQILSAESDQEALRRLMGLLSKLAKMKACAVVTWEPNPDVAGTVYRFGDCMRTDQEVLRWVDATGFAQSAPSRAFVLQSGMRKFPLSEGDALQVLIGIQTPEVIYGVLVFETEDLSILKAGSLNLLTLLVNQTALSIQDQLLRREMREKTTLLEANAETMSTILDVSNRLIGQFEIEPALTMIAQAIRKALGFGSVIFALRDPRGTSFIRRAQAGLDDVWDEVRVRKVPAREIEVFMNPDFRVSNSFFVSHTSLRRSEHSFFVRADDVDEGYLRPDEWHENDMLLVPLMSGEQMVGYLSVREPADGKIPSIERVRTLEVFATQAVTAIQSAWQYEEIRRLTFIDALTPAFNHRYFQDALRKEIVRHTRSGHSLTLAILDIDNFKSINDTYGHPAGDEILKGLVAELMEHARETDVVARYGGEEFAIILPETEEPAGRDAAERFRLLASRRDFTIADANVTLRITVSIGVAVYPADGTTPADLINRADAALYWAKKHGKNQVAVAREVFGETIASEAE